MKVKGRVVGHISQYLKVEFFIEVCIDVGKDPRDSLSVFRLQGLILGGHVDGWSVSDEVTKLRYGLVGRYEHGYPLNGEGQIQLDQLLVNCIS